MFMDTANFYSLFILIQLICSMIYMSCSIFLFDTVSLLNLSISWFRLRQSYINSLKGLNKVASLLNSLIQLSTLFFQVLQHFSLNIGVLFVCVFVSSSNLFLYCYFGSRSTQHKLSYSNVLYESMWFELPVGIQRFMIVMIVNAHRPLHYHGFGIARLNLDTFCSVNSKYVIQFDE